MKNPFYPSGRDLPMAGDFVVDLRRPGRTGIVLMRTPEDIRVYWSDLMQEVIEHQRVETSIASNVISVEGYLGVAKADHVVKEAQRLVIDDLEAENEMLRVAIRTAKAHGVVDPGHQALDDALNYKPPQRDVPAGSGLYVLKADADAQVNHTRALANRYAQEAEQYRGDLVKTQLQAKRSAEAYTSACGEIDSLRDHVASLQHDFDQAKIDIGLAYQSRNEAQERANTADRKLAEAGERADVQESAVGSIVPALKEKIENLEAKLSKIIDVLQE